MPTLWSTSRSRTCGATPGLGVVRLGIYEYLVIEGLAEVTVGGARSLLERLSKIYIRDGGQPPPVHELDDGWVTRIAPIRIRGWGPWQRANPM